ncbi:unnamed protein product [Phaeothamnion confervicola]
MSIPSILRSLTLCLASSSAGYSLSRRTSSLLRSHNSRLVARNFASMVDTADPPRVAVIGAGAAGLVAIRSLRDAGLRVSCFDAQPEPGGVWRYRPEGVLYRGLVTNLPKQIMQFLDYPFPKEARSFLTHQDVFNYLRNYARDHDLLSLVGFSCAVTAVRGAQTPSRAAPGGYAWLVTHRRLEAVADGKATGGAPSSAEADVTELFDAVVVCNGHYERSSIPRIPGLDDRYSGRILHSRDYDAPEPFRGQRVLCIGARASGTDLAREISEVAKEVRVCDTSVTETTRGGAGHNIWRHPAITAFSGGTAVSFADGSAADVDAVVLCTGFDYDFPFLEAENGGDGGLVRAADRRVAPLYLQLFHAAYPTLSFVGLPHSVVPFPLFELQARREWQKE